MLAPFPVSPVHRWRSVVRHWTRGAPLTSAALQVALVKPGMPFQVVANFQSKRKTPTQVSFYKERLFGSDAEALSGRKPHLVISSPQTLLGRTAQHPLVQAFHSTPFFGAATDVNARRGLNFVMPEDSGMPASYTAEEITSMLLAHAREFVSDFAGVPVVDVVLTVPAYYTQRERLALMDAADLAGLKVLALVDENTAAAVHYGIDRVQENGTHTMMLYNMGAESTQVRRALCAPPAQPGARTGSLSMLALFSHVTNLACALLCRCQWLHTIRTRLWKRGSVARIALSARAACWARHGTRRWAAAIWTAPS
ncbi:hypothetical protein EON67_01200 [archaeon]|nr:MAG: hypothetical protein EON67_01200 [archaeon]